MAVHLWTVIAANNSNKQEGWHGRYVHGHSETQQYAEAKAVLQHSARGKFQYHRLAEATPTGQLRRLKAFAEAR